MKIVEVTDIPKLEAIIDVPLDDSVQVYKTCKELEELCVSQFGIGISAVQAGVPWKLFLVRGDGTCPLVPKSKFGYFANCEYSILPDDDRLMSREGCLSLRNEADELRFFMVERGIRIRVTGQQLFFDPVFRYENIDVELRYDQSGIVFQHEIDHHKGVLISDIGQEVFDL